jgi:hypothetical protein
MRATKFDPENFEIRTFRAGSSAADMPVAAATFARWTGGAPAGLAGSIANKPLCSVGGNPAVAELALAAALAARGRRAVWLDVYHRRAQFSMTQERKLDEFLEAGTGDAAADRALRSLVAAKGGKLGGLWDVFAWADGRTGFFELKQRGTSDRLRPGQIETFRLAQRAVPETEFRVVEWDWA